MPPGCRRPARLLVLVALAVACLRGTAVGEQAEDERFAQTWRWAQFTTASGLASNAVVTACDVPGDTLWTVAKGTLFRFDGYRWQPVEIPGHPYAVTTIAVTSHDELAAIVAGRLWIGNLRGFREVPVSLPEDVEFIAVARAISGPVLLVTNTQILYESDGHFCRRQEAAARFGLAFNLRQAGAGVWLSTTEGLVCWNGRQWSLRLKAGPVPFDLLAAYERPDESAWAYIQKPAKAQGFYYWPSAGAPRPVQLPVASPIKSLVEGRNGDLLAVHLTGETTILEHGQWHGLSLGRRMINDGRGLGIRGNGDIWVATERGLLLYRASSTRWTWDGYPPPDDRNAVNAMARGADGTIWMATGAGLVRRAPGGQRQFLASLGAERAGSLTGIAFDTRQRLWVSSGYGIKGVRYLDDQGWHAFTDDPTLAHSAVHRITRDREGNLWFLAIAYDPDRAGDFLGDAPGAFRMSPDGRIRRFGVREGLPSGRVYEVAEAPDGSYWFATNASLSHWKDGAWRHWTRKDGLKGQRVFTVAVDTKGVVWFAHQAFGLGRLEGDQLTYITTADGLATDATWNVVPDPYARRLWVAGLGGLSLLQDGHWTAFDERHGLPNTRLWALLPDRDRLHIGCNGGGYVALSYSDPAPPPLVLSEPPAIQAGVTLLRWRALSWWGEVASEDIPTRVRIDDGGWSPWSSERTLRATGLSSGRHMIWIEAKGLLGAVAAAQAPLAVTIEPALWLRPIFYVPIALLASAVLVLLGMMYVRQRRHHKEVTAREAWFNKAFEASPLPAVIVDLKQGRIQAVNERFVKETGYAREELIGRTAEEMGLMEPSPTRDEAVRQLNETGSLKDFPIETRSKSGELKEVLAYLEVIELNGQPSVLGQFFDQTEHRRLQAQLQQAQRLESVGRLAGGVAHDFNNLLTVVLGNASLLDSHLPDGDPRRGEVEQITIAGERAERLTKQLLAFARKQSVEPHVISVNDVVLRTDRMLRRVIGEDVELVTLMSPEVHPVFIDPGQLEQVLLNMAINARDAMPNGGTLTIATGNIAVRPHEAQLELGLTPGPFARLSITDTGIGMLPHVAERIFEPFFTTKEPGKGTGLGLSTCYGIVKQASGRILVESTLGHGTTFHVDLPRTAVASAQAADTERRQESPGGQETVLLVEDEVQVRRLAASVLRHRGYDVLEAASGPEALTLAASFRATIDILVTDIVMPQMRGTELARRLRLLRPRARVLFVSGYTDDEVFRQEAGSEPFSFLAKPFTPAQLSQRVRELLDQAG